MRESLEVVDQRVFEAALVVERVRLHHSHLRVGRAVVSLNQGVGRLESLSANVPAFLGTEAHKD